MQGKRKLYDIEGEKNYLEKKIPQRKQSVVKSCQQFKPNQNQHIYPYPKLK